LNSPAYVGEGAEEVPFNFIAAIDTATNTELGDDIPWPSSSCCLAVSPDGKYLYTIGIFELTELSVIDTATNARVGGLEFGGGVPAGLAITPDGKAVYLSIDTNVLVINTATRTVVATVPGVAGPVAITPDGKRAYVASSPVSVIDTATNTVVAKVPVGSQPSWVAVTPDGKYAYVTNQGSNNVSVIDTASNTVRATVAVGDAPVGVGIIPPPPGVPFSAFSAKLEVHLGHKPNTDHFNLNASFTLGSASNGINPPTEPVTLKVGTFTTTIPPNSFKIADDQDDQNDQEEGVGMKRFGPFRFHGVIDGVRLEVGIEPTGAKRYAFHANAHDANLAGTTNPVTVTLIIGDDSGTTPVKAEIQ
jgi:YVTN family beta-propeller protein